MKELCSYLDKNAGISIILYLTVNNTFTVSYYDNDSGHSGDYHLDSLLSAKEEFTRQIKITLGL